MEIQHLSTYNISEMESSHHRLSLNMTAVRTRQSMLRRMSSCPEELDWRPEMDFRMRHLSQDVVHRHSESVQNDQLCKRSQWSVTRDETHAEERVTLRRQRKLETATELDDPEGPVHVRVRHVERQLGCCPRQSLERRLLKQDSMFDINPEFGCHPLLRCHSDPSLVNSPSTDLTDCSDPFKMLKAMLFGEDVSI